MPLHSRGGGNQGRGRGSARGRPRKSVAIAEGAEEATAGGADSQSLTVNVVETSYADSPMTSVSPKLLPVAKRGKPIGHNGPRSISMITAASPRPVEPLPRPLSPWNSPPHSISAITHLTSPSGVVSKKVFIHAAVRRHTITLDQAAVRDTHVDVGRTLSSPLVGPTPDFTTDNATENCGKKAKKMRMASESPGGASFPTESSSMTSSETSSITFDQIPLMTTSSFLDIVLARGSMDQTTIGSMFARNRQQICGTASDGSCAAPPMLGEGGHSTSGDSGAVVDNSSARGRRKRKERVIIKTEVLDPSLDDPSVSSASDSRYPSASSFSGDLSEPDVHQANLLSDVILGYSSTTTKVTECLPLRKAALKSYEDSILAKVPDTKLKKNRRRSPAKASTVAQTEFNNNSHPSPCHSKDGGSNRADMMQAVGTDSITPALSNRIACSATMTYPALDNSTALIAQASVAGTHSENVVKCLSSEVSLMAPCCVILEKINPVTANNLSRSVSSDRRESYDTGTLCAISDTLSCTSATTSSTALLRSSNVAVDNTVRLCKMTVDCGTSLHVDGSAVNAQPGGPAVFGVSSATSVNQENCDSNVQIVRRKRRWGKKWRVTEAQVTNAGAPLNGVKMLRVDFPCSTTTPTAHSSECWPNKRLAQTSETELQKQNITERNECSEGRTEVEVEVVYDMNVLQSEDLLEEEEQEEAAVPDEKGVQGEERMQGGEEGQGEEQGDECEFDQADEKGLGKEGVVVDNEQGMAELEGLDGLKGVKEDTAPETEDDVEELLIGDCDEGELESIPIVIEPDSADRDTITGNSMSVDDSKLIAAFFHRPSQIKTELVDEDLQQQHKYNDASEDVIIVERGRDRFYSSPQIEEDAYDIDASSTAGNTALSSTSNNTNSSSPATAIEACNEEMDSVAELYATFPLAEVVFDTGSIDNCDSLSVFDDMSHGQSVAHQPQLQASPNRPEGRGNEERRRKEEECGSHTDRLLPYVTPRESVSRGRGSPENGRGQQGRREMSEEKRRHTSRNEKVSHASDRERYRYVRGGSHESVFAEPANEVEHQRHPASQRKRSLSPVPKHCSSPPWAYDLSRWVEQIPDRPQPPSSCDQPFNTEDGPQPSRSRDRSLDAYFQSCPEMVDTDLRVNRRVGRIDRGSYSSSSSASSRGDCADNAESCIAMRNNHLLHKCAKTNNTSRAYQILLLMISKRIAFHRYASTGEAKDIIEIAVKACMRNSSYQTLREMLETLRYFQPRPPADGGLASSFRSLDGESVAQFRYLDLVYTAIKDQFEILEVDDQTASDSLDLLDILVVVLEKMMDSYPAIGARTRIEISHTINIQMVFNSVLNRCLLCNSIRHLCKIFRMQRRFVAVTGVVWEKDLLKRALDLLGFVFREQPFHASARECKDDAIDIARTAIEHNIFLLIKPYDGEEKQNQLRLYTTTSCGLMYLLFCAYLRTVNSDLQLKSCGGDRSCSGDRIRAKFTICIVPEMRERSREGSPEAVDQIKIGLDRLRRMLTDVCIPKIDFEMKDHMAYDVVCSLSQIKEILSCRIPVFGTTVGPTMSRAAAGILGSHPTALMPVSHTHRISQRSCVEPLMDIRIPSSITSRGQSVRQFDSMPRQWPFHKTESLSQTSRDQHFNSATNDRRTSNHSPTAAGDYPSLAAGRVSVAAAYTSVAASCTSATSTFPSAAAAGISAAAAGSYLSSRINVILPSTVNVQQRMSSPQQLSFMSQQPSSQQLQPDAQPLSTWSRTSQQLQTNQKQLQTWSVKSQVQTDRSHLNTWSATSRVQTMQSPLQQHSKLHEFKTPLLASPVARRPPGQKLQSSYGTTSSNRHRFPRPTPTAVVQPPLLDLEYIRNHPPPPFVQSSHPPPSFVQPDHLPASIVQAGHMPPSIVQPGHPTWLTGTKRSGQDAVGQGRSQLGDVDVYAPATNRPMPSRGAAEVTGARQDQRGNLFLPATIERQRSDIQLRLGLHSDAQRIGFIQAIQLIEPILTQFRSEVMSRTSLVVYNDKMRELLIRFVDECVKNATQSN